MCPHFDYQNISIKYFNNFSLGLHINYEEYILLKS